jgi:hypothetical protein
VTEKNAGGRPPKERIWDGEVRHLTKPGPTGFKKYGCLCPDGCAQAAEVIREKARVNDKKKRAEAIENQNFKHGITGYRAYGCRCDECKVAGRLRNEENRALGRNRRSYRAGDVVVERAVVEEDAGVNWDEVAHLRPGHGVRRRSAS